MKTEAPAGRTQNVLKPGIKAQPMSAGVIKGIYIFCQRREDMDRCMSLIGSAGGALDVEG